MDPDTESDDEGYGLDAYWRRRVIVLGTVLASGGLLFWACSNGGAEKTEPVSEAVVTSSPSASGAVIPTTIPTITVTATARVTVTPKAAQRDGDACGEKDVVVGLTVDQGAYSRRERPHFRLTVVNTGARACTYGVGPKDLELRVTSGSDRVWSSAHCAPGQGTQIQLLRRGIPHVTEFHWDRKRSAEGCSGNRSKARPGTYVVTVKGAKVEKQIFRLT